MGLALAGSIKTWYWPFGTGLNLESINHHMFTCSGVVLEAECRQSLVSDWWIIRSRHCDDPLFCIANKISSELHLSF